MSSIRFVPRFRSLVFATLAVSLAICAVAGLEPRAIAGEDFTVLALCKLDITNPQTTIYGDVGLGPYAVQNFSDGVIDGFLVVDPSANNRKSNNVKILDGVCKEDLSGIVAEDEDASDCYANLKPTQCFKNITGSTTISGNGGLNVIDITSISLSGSAVLTLEGGPNDIFIINVTGKFAMSGSTRIDLDGIDANQVLFNIIGTGEQVAFTGKSLGQGTFLAVDRNIAVSGATIHGALIGCNIAITSAAKVCGNPFYIKCPFCDP